MDNNIMNLKSGTDIRGIAINSVEGEEVNLTDEVVEKIAYGFAMWLIEKKEKLVAELSIAIGHDSRLSADRIKETLIGTLSRIGIRIFDCSLSSTPAMFMTTIDLNCDAAIEITASHHPFNRNGLKFFTKEGGLNGKDIEKILENTMNIANFKKVEGVDVKSKNYMKKYAKTLRKMVCREVNAENYEKPLEGFKIIVDAGNGVGGFYAYDVLKPLGADITGSQFLEPDGNFKNHIPNPEDEIAMKSIVDATLKYNADLGIIFDTDVDRAGAVNSDGEEINRNSLIAIASNIVLESNKGATIVTDSITSDGLNEYIEKELGGVHDRFKRGYNNVINEAKRLNALGINAPLAIETSGHAAMRENHFLDDGAYLITKVIIKMVKLKNEGKDFSHILNKLKKPKESVEYRIKIEADNFRSYGESIISDLVKFSNIRKDFKIAPNNKEGIRVSFDKDNGDGWFLLRLSVHDPVMALNVESNQLGGCEVILGKIKGFLQGYKGLNTSILNPYNIVSK